jgi:glycerophosphoryl diester phosphodiesterase
MVFNIAHRGFSSAYPENSLLAIKKAIELGVDCVEIDVHLSKDNHVVVMHDSNLKRLTSCNGKIALKTIHELRQCKLKKGSHQIPTLAEVFPLFKGETKLNIEIKGFRPAWKVVELIKKHMMQDKAVVSSGSVTALRIIRHEMPSLPTAFIFYVSPGNTKQDIVMSLLSKLSFKVTQFIVLWFTKLSKAGSVHLMYAFATKRFIKRLKKRGYAVNVWVVNTPALMRKMIARGVDGIMTNYPDRLKNVLKEKPPKKKGISLRRINLRNINLNKIKIKKINLKKIKALGRVRKKK